MNFASALLYPILLLFPAAGARDAAPGGDVGEQAVEAPVEAHAWPPYEIPGVSAESPYAASLLQHALPLDAWQVRIEQRMTIRITPRTGAPLPPDMFVGMPGGDGVPQFTERKIGKCLSIAGIASVRPDRANRLLLFMRDQRVVSAELDRSCRARDFYSGFLLERSEDGRVCVDRDTLLSRSGMNCKLTRIRELVEQDR
ncbi:MAG TPA: hypothetical protein VMQ93_04705 [Novosphingobium sp.]|nr:hypothetical protein [Novosphingobium sp.]